MFPYQIVRTPFSFSKILGGLSKTLSLANQMFPLYEQARPLIANARNAFSVLKPLVQNFQSLPTKKESVQINNVSAPKFFL